MNFYKSAISFLLILFCSFHSKAQDNYVYEDSSLMYNDSINATGAEENMTGNEDGNNETANNYIADTMLRNNGLTVTADSVEALKKAVPFVEYAANLDSLLKALQKDRQNGEQAQYGSAKRTSSWLERVIFSPVTSIVFWILAAFFIAFILYKLFFIQGFFQRQIAKSNVTALPEETENLLQGADYTKLITQAAGNKNYSMAIRYHFLQTLQKLVQKDAIQFAPDKTNYQYIHEIEGKTYKKEFVSLSMHYEYIWYGGFNINEDIFIAIQEKFKQFNSRL